MWEDARSVRADRLDEHRADLVRVRVRRRTTVLEVTEPGIGGRHRDPDRGAAIAHAVAELVDAAGLVLAGEALVVARAIDLDVLLVALAELLARRFDHLQAAGAARLLGADVRVRAGAVPVALDRLRVERRADAEVL